MFTDQKYLRLNFLPLRPLGLTRDTLIMNFLRVHKSELVFYNSVPMYRPSGEVVIFLNLCIIKALYLWRKMTENYIIFYLFLRSYTHSVYPFKI